MVQWRGEERHFDISWWSEGGCLEPRRKGRQAGGRLSQEIPIEKMFSNKYCRCTEPQEVAEDLCYCFRKTDAEEK